MKWEVAAALPSVAFVTHPGVNVKALLDEAVFASSDF